jgi:hypothetical protein
MACGKTEVHTKEQIFTRTILGNKEHQLAPISFPLSPRYVHPTQFSITYEITAVAVRSKFGTSIIQTIVHNVVQRILQYYLYSFLTERIYHKRSPSQTYCRRLGS